MNSQKTKKLAFMAVAVVMAGSLALAMSACTPGDDGGGTQSGNVNIDENGKLTYAAGTELRMNVGNQNSSHPAQITFQSAELGSTVTLPDGKSYNVGNLKPAWQALQDELDVKFVDVFQNRSSDSQITTADAQQEMGNYDLITASASSMTQNTDLLVNLNDYLEYMPNYKAFLEANPAVYYSLTSNTTNGAMYYAPYFDGLNDIEKYVLAEKNWISDLLTADDAALATATTTFAAQASSKTASNKEVKFDGTKASVESFMGTTGSYTVDTTSLDGNSVVTGKVDYDAVIAALKDTGSDLYKAVAAALPSGTAVQTESGNIVDIQNQIINETEGAVTGGQLTKVLQEYIDVAYTVGDKGYTDRDDVFNSVSALWDVDLLVAISRCAVTSGALIGADTAAKQVNIYGVAAREGVTQRRVDLSAFVGELYGVRGLESRNEYTYIDSKGDIKDARANADSYDAMEKFSALATEGLLYTGDEKVDADRNFDAGPSTLFMHDYSQTQTTSGFKLTADEYNVSPILTPVSRWDTNDDGTYETVMRFTESWRSVKNTGFCISLQGVQGNADKLSAALAFIDYLFSNDGQILMTYGPQSSSNTNPDGWWYSEEATGVKLEDVAEQVEGSTQWTVKSEYESQYFVYKNKVYTSDIDYNRAIPAITDANMNFFLGKDVNGFTLGTKPLDGMSCSTNYTNYARWIVGTTLPIGNKDQGFEYQCTAECALEGAAIVSQALANGTIKHVEITLGDADSLWYLIAPTSLALTTSQQAQLTNSEQTLISGTFFLNSSSTDQRTNLYLDIMFYGFDTTKYIGGSGTNPPLQASAEATVNWLNGAGLEQRLNIFTTAWNRTCNYFDIK